jgi:hypothetical protein
MARQAIVGAPQARFTQVQMPWPEQQHKAVLRIGQATDHHKERSYDEEPTRKLRQEEASRPQTTLISLR